MALSFYTVICLALVVLGISVLTSCTDEIRVTEAVQVSDNDEKVTDPSATSSEL